MPLSLTQRLAAAAAGATFLAVAPLASANTIAIGSDAMQYGILFEGNKGNTLQITNVNVDGSVGVGLTGLAHDSGPSTITGAINFAAANTGQFSNNNGANALGGVNYGVASVANALNTVNALNATLGAEAGTNLAIHNTTTINASAGILDASGDRVFTLTSFNTTNNDVITINGDAAGDNVVINIGFSVNFNNQVVISGFHSADQILWNFVGGSNLTGGPTLQVNTNASSHPTQSAQGIFLDPNGAISLTNANITGRVFGGDTHDFQYVSGTTLDTPEVVPLPPAAFGGLALLGGLAGTRFLRRRSV